MKSETLKQLAKAVLSVMKEVKGVEKSMTVGSGNYAYKGVSDYEVKQAFTGAMAKHGLSIIPIDIEPDVKIDRWDETQNGTTKQKQQVFASVKVKYLLLHESGEFLEVCGYGHGVDTQDKAAGKATTYALKYALLYMFMTPTGKILDSDSDHSDEQEVPKAKAANRPIFDQKEFEKNKGSVQVYVNKGLSASDIKTKIEEKYSEVPVDVFLLITAMKPASNGKATV